MYNDRRSHADLSGNLDTADRILRYYSDMDLELKIRVKNTSVLFSIVLVCKTSGFSRVNGNVNQR